MMCKTITGMGEGGGKSELKIVQVAETIRGASSVCCLQCLRDYRLSFEMLSLWQWLHPVEMYTDICYATNINVATAALNPDTFQKMHPGAVKSETTMPDPPMRTGEARVPFLDGRSLW